MRILISTSNIGDSYIFSLDLAKSIQDHGVEVFLVITGTPLTEQQKKQLEIVDYAFAEFKQEWMENPWEDIKEAGLWLLKIKEMVKPDLVHLNSFAFGALPWNVPVVTVIHSCALSWWKAVYDEMPPAKYIVYKQKARAGFRASDVVVSPGFSMLSLAERFYGPFKRSRVIPHGRSSYDFRSDIKEKYIFSSGNIRDEGKNIKSILNIGPHLHYPVYIEGDNNNSSTEKKPENVFFTGPLNKKQRIDWLAKAFVYLSPAKYEPFGYSFIDAAFSKCALVGNNLSSLREIWQDAMIYVQNEEDLIYKVNELMENTEQLYLQGQKAFEAALENHTLEKMTRHYYQLYNEVLMFQSARVGHRKPAEGSIGI